MNRENRALLYRLWRDWLLPHRRQLLVNLLLVILVGAATGAYPLVIQWVMDGFANRDYRAIQLAPLLVIAATLVKAAALYAQAAQSSRICSLVEESLQRAMYRQLIHADVARLAEESSASLATRFSADMVYVHAAVQKLISHALRDLATVVSVMAAMLWIDWQLTLMSLLVLPLAVGPVASVGRRLRRLAKSNQEQLGQMTAHVEESLKGIRLAKSYRLEDWLIARADQNFAQIRTLQIRAAKSHARIAPFMEALAGFVIAGIMAFVGWRISAGAVTVGDFTSFITALLLAATPARALGNLNALLQQGFSAMERIFAILDAPRTVAEAPHAPALVVTGGEIRFETVSFNYPDGTAVLKDFDLTIHPGERVAFVGRSGAGKSTLFNLLPRFYDVSSGRILIDGQDIRSVTLASLRDAIALVGQEAVIFDDTAAANIGFGRQNATPAAVRAAAEAAQADGFLSALPLGYDTPIAGRLSGGERQRVTIARAFLKDAPILLLDEATSALDAQSEHLVRQALDRLARGRTTLIIAHRLSTVLDADRIVVMDQGQIVESGNHADLLAKNGVYADLYRKQFGV